MASDTLKIKEFRVDHVKFGHSYKFTYENNELTIPDKLLFSLDPEFDSIQIKLISPHHLDVQTNSIMDFVPISTKVLGKIGEGITHTLTGVTLMITGVDKNGRQIHDFGSSDGNLKDQVVLNKAGTPNEDDYIIMFNVILKADTVLSRPAITKIFDRADDYLQPIRKLLKMVNGHYAFASHEYHNVKHPGKPKVVVIKQVAGQGAMYDNMVLPDEPSGMKNGVSIIDMDNFPVLLTANEYRDGAIHAMV